MKQLKFILGALLAVQFAGCSDDLNEGKYELPVSGDEISFGAQTSGFSSESRTVYGLPEGEEGQFGSYSALTISWVYDQDKVRVFCPQASDECKWADYTVKKSTDEAAYLAKNGEIGVRWGETSNNHKFYAFYPLEKMAAGSLEGKTTVTANIPVAQERGTLLTNENTPSITDPNWKIIAPDMSYCMMAGTGEWEAGSPKEVALNFKPLVTVLDVVVNGPATETIYKIVSVSVRSKSQNIVGDFTYNFANGTYNFPETSGDNKIATVSCIQGEGTESMPVELSKDQKLNLKFFLLPRTDIKVADLSVSVLMEGGYVLTQSLDPDGTSDATLASGKITRVITPKISAPKTNNWMSLIGDNVLFSQLSLPGSRFSYTGSMKVTDYNPETDIAMKYQDLYVATDAAGETTTQFDEGIRAFDVDLEIAYSGAIPYVYAGTGLVNMPGTSENMSLTNVLDALKNKVQSGNKTEGVVVFLNFVNNNVGSDVWAQTVNSALHSWDNSNPNILQSLTTATTMSDMRGRIAVVMNLVYTSDTPPTSPINYISGYGTGRQNLSIRELTYNGTSKVYVQNLFQVNNPSIAEGGDYAWHSKDVGLLPYYITEKYAKREWYTEDLIQSKIDLLNKMIVEIKTDGGNSLFINDCSGFCVVKDDASTGRSGYRYWYSSTWYPLYDYQRLPTSSNVIFPVNPDTEKGNGGDPARFAELFNAKATEAIQEMVNTGRVPMGIVLMNFVGKDKVTLGNEEYSVQGIRLPGLVMSNNFLFDLKEKQ